MRRYSQSEMHRLVFLHCVVTIAKVLISVVPIVVAALPFSYHIALTRLLTEKLVMLEPTMLISSNFPSSRMQTPFQYALIMIRIYLASFKLLSLPLDG